RQTDTKTSTEFMQRFLRLAGFLGAAAGTTEEQTNNFRWGLRRSTLNHLMWEWVEVRRYRRELVAVGLFGNGGKSGRDKQWI
nr:zinc finger, CCHC-type, retrotransposon Gag domain protein [Tanacetum cinerariifolium]